MARRLGLHIQLTRRPFFGTRPYKPRTWAEVLRQQSDNSTPVLAVPPTMPDLESSYIEIVCMLRVLMTPL